MKTLSIGGRFWVVLTILSLAWGTTWAAIRVGLRGIPPLTGVSGRFAIAAAVLFLVAYYRKIPIGRGGSVERSLWIVNAVFSFAVPYVLVYWAEQWVPSGLASLLFATYPLFVTLLAHFVTPSDRLGAAAVGGTVLGFLGTAVLLSDDFEILGGPQAFRASVLFLLSPLASAVATVYVRRFGRDVHPLSLTAVPMAITALAVAPFAWLLELRGGLRPVTLDALSVGCLLYLAIVGSALTFTLYFWLLSRVPAAKAALTAYTIPIVAVTFGAIVLAEVVTPKTLIGAAMILGGVGVVVRRANR